MRISFSLSLFLFSLHISSGTLLAQSTFATTGSSVSTAAGSVSWTIGEPLTETFSTADAQLTQGVHQPLLLDLSDLDHPALKAIGIEVFPNPAVHSLTIRHESAEELTGILFGAMGRPLLRRNLRTGESSIDVTILPAGFYHLAVYRGTNRLGSILIVKP